jgi:hypothetical protein
MDARRSRRWELRRWWAVLFFVSKDFATRFATLLVEQPEGQNLEVSGAGAPYCLRCQRKTHTALECEGIGLRLKHPYNLNTHMKMEMANSLKIAVDDIVIGHNNKSEKDWSYVWFKSEEAREASKPAIVNFIEKGLVSENPIVVSQVERECWACGHMAKPTDVHYANNCTKYIGKDNLAQSKIRKPGKWRRNLPPPVKFPIPHGGTAHKSSPYPPSPSTDSKKILKKESKEFDKKEQAGTVVNDSKSKPDTGKDKVVTEAARMGVGSKGEKPARKAGDEKAKEKDNDDQVVTELDPATEDKSARKAETPRMEINMVTDSPKKPPRILDSPSPENTQKAKRIKGNSGKSNSGKSNSGKSNSGKSNSGKSNSLSDTHEKSEVAGSKGVQGSTRGNKLHAQAQQTQGKSKNKHGNGTSNNLA